MTTLTDRELQVLALAADGLTNPQIAKRTHAALGTVAHALQRVRRKLGAANTVHAVAIAYRTGVMPLPRRERP